MFAKLLDVVKIVSELFLVHLRGVLMWWTNWYEITKKEHMYRLWKLLDDYSHDQMIPFQECVRIYI